MASVCFSFKTFGLLFFILILVNVVFFSLYTNNIFLLQYKIFPNIRPMNVSSDYKSEVLQKCSNVSYKLKGDLVIDEIGEKSNQSDVTLTKIIQMNPHVSMGGYFSPSLCNAEDEPIDSVAIIVPFRDRLSHLYTFLGHMHPILTRQRLKYKIYIVNQEDGAPFNRGKLINIGYKEAMKEQPWKCIVMHDVDYLPLNDNNIYTCWPQPHRLIAASSKWSYGYASPYKNFFGGVAAMKPDQFEAVNGFYNEFYGWGAEDDDLAKRVQLHSMKIDILNQTEGLRIGKYFMLSHTPAEPAPDRLEKLTKTVNNMKMNGLNNLEYEVISKFEESLYTNITVNLLYTGSKKN